MTTISQKNGHKLQAARSFLGLTQAELGAALGPDGRGYTPRAVYAWENGDRKIPPSVEKLIIIMVENKKAYDAIAKQLEPSTQYPDLVNGV